MDHGDRRSQHHVGNITLICTSLASIQVRGQDYEAPHVFLHARSWLFRPWVWMDWGTKLERNLVLDGMIRCSKYCDLCW